MLHCTVLYCTVLYYAVLRCAVLRCAVLHRSTVYKEMCVSRYHFHPCSDWMHWQLSAVPYLML